MRVNRAAALGLAVAVTLAIVGCGEGGPTAPPRGAPGALHDGSTLGLLPGTLGLVGGLLSCAPLPYDSVTDTIGPAGGTLQVGPHSLIVPPGALAAPTAITAILPPDSVNLVRFQPQGLVFQVPAELVMSYANCATGVSVPGHIAYVDDLLSILESLLAHRDGPAQSVTSRIEHFSGYAVAW